MPVITIDLEKKVLERGFPKIMRHSGTTLTVLFTDKEKGVVLDPGGGDHEVGYYTNGWAIWNFEDYNKPVTIRNK